MGDTEKPKVTTGWCRECFGPISFKVGENPIRGVQAVMLVQLWLLRGALSVETRQAV